MNAGDGLRAEHSKALLKVGGRSALFFLATALMQVGSLVTFPILARRLGPADYGLWTMILSLESIALTLVLGGVNTAVVRTYIAHRDDELGGRAVATAVAYAYGAGAVVLCVGLLLGWLQQAIVGERLVGALVVVLGFMILALDVQAETRRGVARARDAIGLYAAASGAQVAVYALGVVLSVSLLQWGLEGALMAYVAGQAVAVGLLRRGIRGPSIRLFDVSLLREMLRFGWPLVPMNLASWVLTASDRYMLAWFHSLSDAGMYSAAYRVGSLVTVVVGAPLNLALAPQLFEMYEGRRSGESLLSLVAVASTVVLFAGVVLAAIGPLVLLVFAGNEYAKAAPLVPMVAIGAAIAGLASLLATALQAPRRNKSSMWAFIVGASANVLANLVLIPRYGMYGAALTTVIGYLVSSMVLLLAARSHLAARSSGIGTHVLLLAVALAAALLFTDVYMSSRPVWCAVFEGVAVIVVLAVIACRVIPASANWGLLLRQLMHDVAFEARRALTR